MNARKQLLTAAAALSLVLAGSFAAPHAAADAQVAYKPIPAGDYNLDPMHCVVGFSIRHLEINWVEGRFKDVSGTIHYNDADPTKSSVSYKTKVDSIDTGIEMRDKHLKTADFFDAAKYPEISFQSTKVERASDHYTMFGDLTLHGVTRPISFPFTLTGAVTDPWGNTRIGIRGTTKINRQDYGMTYGKPMTGGGVDVGNEVNIVLNLEATQAKAK